MKSTFYGDFLIFFTGLQNKLQIGRNSLDFRTTASNVGPKKKKCFQNKTNMKPKKGT